jgi:hypothetical protein
MASFDATTTSQRPLYLFSAKNEAYLRGQTKTPHDSQTSSLIGTIVFCAFFILFGGIFWYAGQNEIAVSRELHQHGVDTVGTVNDRYTSSDDDGTSYYLVGTFMAQDTVYSFQYSVGADRYSKTGIGTTIPVCYSSHNPTIHRLGTRAEQSPNSGTGIVLSGVGMVSAIGGVLLTLSSVYRWAARGDYRDKLIKSGQILYGDITSAERDSDGDVTLHYAFFTPHGSRITGQQYIGTVRDQMQSLRTRSIAVLFLDDKTYMVL